MYVLLLVLIDELFEEDISHTVQIIKIISLTVSVNESARRVRKKLKGDGFQTHNFYYQINLHLREGKLPQP